ncbi:ricin B lectin domain-containing protein [Trichophaea hybrida]|nr:ricin B lectin domain-containing protein [Trichophaea hybrida]
MSVNLSFGVYFIRCQDSGTVVHVTSDHSNVVCSALNYDQAGTQLFEFKRYKDRYVITNIGTKLVLEMAGGCSTARTPVLSCKYHGGPINSGLFSARGMKIGHNYHLITNAESGTVMDLAGGFLTNGTGIFGYNAHRGSNQKWEFIGVTEHMLSRQIQVPGPERVVEKIVPGPERVIERVIQGPERVVEKVVVNFNDSPDTLRELRELRAQLLRAMEGLSQTLPKVAEFDAAGDRQSGDG